MKSQSSLLLFIAILSTILFLSSFARSTKSDQKDNWEELEIFHRAIALTFHPAEDGDFEPIKNDSDELVEAAQNLLNGNLPAYFEKIENKKLKITLQKELQKLVQQSTDLHSLVEEEQEEKVTDKVLLEKLSSLHDTYHRIEELNNEARKK